MRDTRVYTFHCPVLAPVINCKGVDIFSCRWRGSVYKLLWRDLLVYAVLYASLSCLYRFYLKDAHRK